MIVKLTDKSHVGRNHRSARVVARETEALLVLHEGGVDRMWIGALRLAAINCRYIARGKHCVVGRWRHIGPVRLDIRKVQHPRRLTALSHEIDRAVRRVRRFRMLLGNARRLPRMAHQPARQQLSVAHRGICDAVPRVFLVIAMLPQITIVGRFGRNVLRRPEAVVPLVGFKTAFAGQYAFARFRIHAEPHEAF